MSVRIGLNGFGRIGRYLIRLMANQSYMPVVAINARADNASLAHLFKYDSIHGPFKGSISYDDDGLIINGHYINVSRKKVGEWIWKDMDVNLVVESTGTIKTRDGLEAHIQTGAAKVIISTASKDTDALIIMGVNDSDYIPKDHHILSAGSCTTNCLAPVVKVLNDIFGIEHGIMTTIHSYTMSQRILDGSQKDLRRARAATLSLIPTTTGAAKAIGLVIPELEGKIDGMAIRVPTPNVSLVDFTCELKQPVTVDDINNTLKNAAEGKLKNILGYCDEPLVSIDYTGDIHGGVVDALSTSVISSKLAKVLVWYDNEAGFTNQLLRLINLVEKSM